MKIMGWKLNEVDRAKLLRQFPPVWPDVIADHVTLMSSKLPRTKIPEARQGLVVGQMNDGKGLQALVVEIDQSIVRPDGSIYHITWSIDRARGREPKDSNAVLARLGWEALKEPISIGLTPASWP